MDDPLRTTARDLGVFLRREAISCGYTDKMLASLRRQGVLHRVRHGAYCFGDVWDSSTAEEQHLILARAVLRMTSGKVVLSHTTALLAHGIAVWGADLSKVHVTRLERGSGRDDVDVVHHVGMCPEDDVTEVRGLPVTVAPRAVIEAATTLGLESAVVSADSAMHLRRCDPGTLRDQFKRLNHWADSRRIHMMLMLMDARSESVGETRGRMLFREQGIPRPELQWEVYDDSGALVAVTDFVWHDRKAFGEFDGKIKYTKLVRPDEDPGDVVFREKNREDLVRGLTGYGCGRMIWSDLSRRAQTAAYFRRILGLD